MPTYALTDNYQNFRILKESTYTYLNAMDRTFNNREFHGDFLQTERKRDSRTGTPEKIMGLRSGSPPVSEPRGPEAAKRAGEAAKRVTVTR